VSSLDEVNNGLTFDQKICLRPILYQNPLIYISDGIFESDGPESMMKGVVFVILRRKLSRFYSLGLLFKVVSHSHSRLRNILFAKFAL
jgi:hypothetical protein